MICGETDIDLIILMVTIILAVISLFVLDVYWGWFGLCFATALGIWELIRKLRKDQTLTQKFRYMMENHPAQAWFAIISLNLFFIYLNFHLLAKFGIWK